MKSFLIDSFIFVEISAGYELIISVSVPLTPLSTFMDRWIFGEVLCKVTGASQVRIHFITLLFVFGASSRLKLILI